MVICVNWGRMPPGARLGSFDGSGCTGFFFVYVYVFVCACVCVFVSVSV